MEEYYCIIIKCQYISRTNKNFISSALYNLISRTNKTEFDQPASI